MKKSTIEMMNAYLNGQTVDLDTLREEVSTEWERLTAKSNEKNAMYDAAKVVVMGVLRNASGPMTAKEIYEKCSADLPDEFTQAKMQYAFRSVWMDEVVAEAQEKGAKVYSAK